MLYVVMHGCGARRSACIAKTLSLRLGIRRESHAHIRLRRYQRTGATGDIGITGAAGRFLLDARLGDAFFAAFLAAFFGAAFFTAFLAAFRSEEHTSELQSLMRISYAVFCLKKKNY